MFGMGFKEFLVVGMIFLVVIGPKEIPNVMRKLGRWSATLRRTATKWRVQSGIDELLHSEGLHESLQELQELSKIAKGQIADLKRQTQIEDVHITYKEKWQGSLLSAAEESQSTLLDQPITSFEATSDLADVNPYIQTLHLEQNAERGSETSPTSYERTYARSSPYESPVESIDFMFSSLLKREYPVAGVDLPLGLSSLHSVSFGEKVSELNQGLSS